ncbi:MAG: class I SAM-dependent methyltransferase [Zoogloeaceae bacterium]|jgi:SAM-dependent methyltransferase|nr:class I SAM-dependent methyltransferase [Zoogloeaceae bacterium]
MKQNDDFWQTEDIESVLACPVCGAEDSHLCHIGRPDSGDLDHPEFELLPGDWNIRRCLACQSYYLAERPTQAAIGKAYVSSYYTHTDARDLHKADNGTSLAWKFVNGYLNHRYHACRQPALSAGFWIIALLPPLAFQLNYFFRHLDARRAQNKRLLDIGCGNGLFLLRAQQAGWSVTGIEIDPLAVQAARQSGLSVTEGAFDSLSSQNEFDVASCSHVIEHVHDPLALLLAMKTYVRPGGTVWLSTPNAQSIGHKLFGEAWYPLEPPRHLQIFSRRGLADLFTRAGFVDIHFHCRGRGAASSFQHSKTIAQRLNKSVLRIPAFLVDILATISAGFSEELIVTARKPE